MTPSRTPFAALQLLANVFHENSAEHEVAGGKSSDALFVKTTEVDDHH